MTDGKRILDDGAPCARALVASADADEAPPANLEARILASLSLPAPPPSAPARLVGTAPAPGIGSFWSRRMGIALAAIGLGAAITASGVITSTSTGTAPSTEAAPSPTPLAAPAPEPEPEPALTPAASGEETSAESTVPVATPDVLPSAPAPRTMNVRPTAKPEAALPARTAPGALAEAKSDSTLAREIALLDAVRARLGAGDTAGAERALDAYDAEIPDGLLRPEATVLRARSLLARGKRAEAERLAEDYLARHPNSVHAARIRALFAD